MTHHWLGKEELLLYYDGETIAGHIEVNLKTAKFEHKVMSHHWMSHMTHTDYY